VKAAVIVVPAGPPRLPDQSCGPGRQPDQEADEKEQDREKGRQCGKCVNADHLTDENGIECPRQCLKNIRGHKGNKKQAEPLPERAGGFGVHQNTPEKTVERHVTA
jgi:hypothetical protein